MNILSNIKTFTASEARDHLYTLIKSTAKGANVYEIHLRGSESVVLMSKSELEAWQETLDILTSPNEIRAVRKARKEKKTIPHSDLLKSMKG